MNSPRRPRRRISQSRLQLRRTRVIFLALLVASVSAAIFVAYHYRLGVPQTLITLLVGGGAPAGLYLAWETFLQTFLQGQPSKAKSKALSEAADELAESIETQWSDEVVVRQFNDYSQLSVSWGAADASLTVSWKDLVDLAEHGPGQPSPPPPGTWANGPDGLAGLDDQLPDVLKRVPTGWLVVLGEPGSGKTMLMVRLVLDLLARRKSGEPVPVLVPITSWDPKKDDLHTWLEERLSIDHPGLAAFVSTDEGEESRIGALLALRKIVPILDGLDEMPPGARRAAIARLNETLARPGRPPQLLVTCRATEYRQAVGEYGKSRIPLRGAAAIELRPLGVEHVAAYLTDDGKDARWIPVVEALGEGTEVGKALRTPLAVSLAAAIYNPHPDDPVDEIPDPADLCRSELYPTAEDIRDHLFEGFIAAAYRSEPWREAEAGQWLTFLARYLNRRGTTSLQWWDLKGLAPRGLVPVVAGAVCGIVAAIAAASGTHVGVGIGIGFGTGLLIALAFGLGIRYATHFKGLRPGPGMAGGLAGAALGGVAAGLVGKLGIGHAASLLGDLPEALGIGIGAGASTRFVGGLTGGLVGAFVGGLLEGVGLGLPAGLVNGLGVGLAAGLTVKYVGWREPAGQSPEWIPRVGISGGLVIGLVVGLIAWREEGIVAGLVVGAVIGGVSSWPFGLRDTDQDLRAVPSPGKALARDASAFRRTALAAGLAAACAGLLGGSLAAVFEVGARVSLYMVVSDGLGIGLASGLDGAGLVE